MKNCKDYIRVRSEVGLIGSRYTVNFIILKIYIVQNQFLNFGSEHYPISSWN